MTIKTATTRMVNGIALRIALYRLGWLFSFLYGPHVNSDMASRSTATETDS